MVYLQIRRLILLAAMVFASNNLFGEIQVLSIKDSAPGQSDGSISISLGDAAPFDIIIKDKMTMQLVLSEEVFVGSVFSTPTDLAPGIYIIEVTSLADKESIGGGCNTILEAEVGEFECDIELIVLDINNVTTIDHCDTENESSRDGSISIHINSSNAYTISWSKSGVYFSSALSVNNLDAGKYLIEITSNDDPDCTVSKVIDIHPCEEFVRDNENEDGCTVDNNGQTTSVELLDIKDAHEGQSDGSIIIRVNSASGTYSRYWTDESGNYYDAEDLHSVPSGMYTFHFDDGCITLQNTFEVKCLGLFVVDGQWMQEGQCSGEVDFRVTINGQDDIVNYSYDWDGGESLVFDNERVLGGVKEYCVTVTDVISNCFRVECYKINIADYEITEILGSCPGGENGNIQIDISNPNNEQVDIEINSVIFQDVNRNSRFQYKINNLAPGEYTLNIKIGSCENENEVVEVGLLDFEKRFTRFDEDEKVCIYNQFCDGEYLGVDFTLNLPADFDFMNVSEDFNFINEFGYALSSIPGALGDIIGLGSIFDFIGGNTIRLIFGANGGTCDIPVMCDGVPIHTVEYDVLDVRAWEYELLVIASDLDQNVKDDLILDIRNNPCGRMKVCPLSLKIVARGLGFPGFTTLPGDGAIIENGCASQTCNSFEQDVVCLNDLFEKYDIELDCENIHKDNVADGIEFLSQFEDNAVYLESDLYAFVKKHEFSNKANCAVMYFCLPAFKLLFSDIESVDCERKPHWPPGGDICEELDDQPNRVLCGYTCFDKGVLANGERDIICIEKLKVVNSPTSGFLNSNNNFESKFPGSSTVNQNFLNFQLVREENHTVPAILINSFEQREYIEYSHDFVNPRILEAEELTWAYQDRDNEINYLLANVDSNTERLLIESQTSTAELDIVFAQTIDVKKFEVIGGNLSLGIKYQGEISIDTLNLISDQVASFVEVLIDSEGNILNHHSIVIGDQFELSSYGEELVYANNYIEGGINKYLIGNSDYNYEISLSEQTTSNLLSVSKSTNSEQITLALNGEGTIDFPSGASVILDQNELMLVSTDATGNIIWSYSMSKNNIDLSKIEIANLDLSGPVVIGFNFDSTIEIDNSNYVSQGLSDIMFLQINNLGELDKVVPIGSGGVETLEGLFVHNDIVYFGGVVAETPLSYNLGNIQFERAGPQVTAQAYLSYYMQDLQQQAISEVRESEQETILDLDVELKFVPNPFNSSFTMEVNSPVVIGDANMRIVNSLGALVDEQSIIVQANKNVFEINSLTDHPNGIYTVIISSEENNFIKTDRIIKIE